MRKIYGGGIIDLFMIVGVEAVKKPMGDRSGRLDLGTWLGGVAVSVKAEMVNLRERFVRWMGRSVWDETGDWVDVSNMVAEGRRVTGDGGVRVTRFWWEMAEKPVETT